MMRLQLGLLPYYPLASGLLTASTADTPLPSDARLVVHVARYRTASSTIRTGRGGGFGRLRTNTATLLELAFSWLARSRWCQCHRRRDPPEQVEAMCMRPIGN